jgi:predicted porin
LKNQNRILAICAAALLLLSSMPASADGFFVGLQAESVTGESVTFGNPVEARNIGAELGYRQQLTASVFVEGGLSFGATSGGIAGFSESIDTSRLNVSVGAYFAPQIYGTVRASRVSTRTDDLTAPGTTRTSSGNLFGVGLGYDINSSVGVQLTADRGRLSSPTGGATDVTSIGVGIRYGF